MTHVYEVVMKELLEWFPKAKFTNGQIKVYMDVLGKYSQEVLIKSMKELKETWALQSPPQPASIRKICEEKLSSRPLADPKSFPWVVRDEKINQLVKTSWENFQNTPLFCQAKLEGWAYFAEQFVKDDAWIQAQAIISPKEKYHYGYSFAYHGGYDWAKETAMSDIKNSYESAKKRGFIYIAVPKQAIEYFQKLSTSKKG